MPKNQHIILKTVAGVARPGESFLVALSGGADSVALLASLTELGHRCEAIHCNYHLRGQESNRDEQHARSVAASLGVNIHVIDCDVDAYRKEHPDTSIEMACRDLRYNAFNEYLATLDLDSIALGHHLEDNIETMLLNMLRGSGIKGLAAMRARRDKNVRPLLQCTKDDILQYLSQRGLSYVTDSSNLSNDYRRNALRNDIIPRILHYFPAGIQGMSNTLIALSSQRELLEDYNGLNEFCYGNNIDGIDLKRLVEKEPHPTEALFELLNEPNYRGYNLTIVKDIVKNYKSSGLIFCGNDGTSYRLDHGMLNLILPDGEGLEALDKETAVDLDDMSNISHIIESDVITPGDFNPQRDNTTAYFDLDRLREYKEIKLRYPRIGDRLKPWGMKGSRLLSDIFTDLHYTHIQRLNVPVLEADGEILWVVGVRASRIATVTPTTRRILCLRHVAGSM